MKIHVNINELFPVFLPTGYGDYIVGDPDNIVLEVDWTDEEVMGYVDIMDAFHAYQKAITAAYNAQHGKHHRPVGESK